MKWSLNHQVAKTDQSTAEFYFPITRQVLRTRETLYEEKQWVFDAQLDKAFSVADTDHALTYGTTLKQQKVTGSRSGNGVCLAVGVGCSAVGAISTRDVLAKVSDFLTRPSTPTACSPRTRSVGTAGPSRRACATTTPGSNRI